MSISNIVIADDGSTHAKEALQIAVDLASKYEAKLTVVHVLTHDSPPEELRHLVEVEHLAEVPHGQKQTSKTSSLLSRDLPVSEAIAEARVVAVLAEKILDNAINKATRSGIDNVSAVTKSGDYANCILDVAKENNADIIIMGRRGLGNLKGLLFGSVSQKVSERADCSVLTVK